MVEREDLAEAGLDAARVGHAAVERLRGADAAEVEKEQVALLAQLAAAADDERRGRGDRRARPAEEVGDRVAVGGGRVEGVGDHEGEVDGPAAASRPVLPDPVAAAAHRALELLQARLDHAAPDRRRGGKAREGRPRRRLVLGAGGSGQAEAESDSEGKTRFHDGRVYGEQGRWFRARKTGRLRRMYSR